MHVTSLKIQSCELIFNEKLYVYSFISIKPSFQKLEAEKIGTQTTQISCQHRHTEEKTEQRNTSGNTILLQNTFYQREILTCARTWIGSSFLSISFILCIWITRPLHNTTDHIHTKDHIHIHSYFDCYELLISYSTLWTNCVGTSYPITIGCHVNIERSLVQWNLIF